jgi:hypothetical protein
MPEDFCECERQLVSERNKRLDKCRVCERLEKKKNIEDASRFVAAQPDLSYGDGLIYVNDKQPEFDD